MDAELDRPKRARDDKTTPDKETETKKQKNEAIRTKQVTQTDKDRSRLKDKDKQTDKDKTRELSQEPRDSAGRWLRIYLRNSCKVPINCSNTYNREKLRQVIKNGESKLQWRLPKYGYEQIYGALISGNITLHDDMFKKIDDREWVKLKMGCNITS